MPEPSCYGSLQVCRIRVAKLAANGEPDPGANNGYVSDAVVTVDLGIELSEGDDFELKNGCGNICQAFKQCDKIKRVNVSLDLCQLDYELIQMLTGGELFTAGGEGMTDPVGFQFPSATDECPNGVSFEFWTKAWDGTTQATPPTFGGAVVYHHFVVTKGQFQISDNTFENDLLTFSLEGFGEENPNLPAAGPFEDWPTAIESAGGITTSAGVFFDDQIPDAVCGSIEVPAIPS